MDQGNRVRNEDASHEVPGGESSRDEAFMHILAHESGVDDIGKLLEKATDWTPIEGYVDDEGTRHHVVATRTFFKTMPKVLFVSLIKRATCVAERLHDEHRRQL